MKKLHIFVLATVLLLALAGCKAGTGPAPDPEPAQPGMADPGPPDTPSGPVEIEVDPGNGSTLQGQDAANAFAAEMAARGMGEPAAGGDGRDLELSWQAGGDSWSCEAVCLSGPGAGTRYDLAWAEAAYADGSVLVSGDPAAGRAAYSYVSGGGTAYRALCLDGDGRIAYLFRCDYSGADVPDGLAERLDAFQSSVDAVAGGEDLP